MSSVSTISALVTGFPPRLRQPQPLPGETLVDLIIRNQPHRWRNFVERLENDLGLSKQMADKLRRGKVDLSDIANPRVEAEMENFVNLCLPTLGRTIEGLVSLKHQTQDPFMQEHNGYTIIEILCPRAVDPNVDKLFQERAVTNGVRVIYTSRELDLKPLLSEIHGDFLWLVPGGTEVDYSLVVMLLERIMRFFHDTPLCAVYMDNADSCIVRTAPLHKIGRTSNSSLNTKSIFRLLKEAGYSAAVDNDPSDNLCSLEEEYGG